MSITWLATNLLAAFLLPPLNGLTLVAVGLLSWRRRPRLARLTAGGGMLLLVVLALPAVGKALLHTLEGEPLSAAAMKQAQAIVVLGGGRYRQAPEYGGDTVSPPTLVRLRYGARLHRVTGLPLLVSGGRPDGEGLSEAQAMHDALVRDFGVPVRWVEETSEDTRQNARHAAGLLRQDGVTRVLLVTHAWHMPRSIRSFERAGIDAIAAPTAFRRDPLTPLDFLPQGYGDSRDALHEWIGMIWYALRS